MTKIDIYSLINQTLTNPDLIPIVHLISHYQNIKTDLNFNQIIVDQLLDIINQDSVLTVQKFDQNIDQVVILNDPEANQIFYFYYNHWHQSYYHLLFDNFSSQLIMFDLETSLKPIINAIIKIIQKQAIQPDWFVVIDCSQIKNATQLQYWQNKITLKMGRAWFSQTSFSQNEDVWDLDFNQVFIRDNQNDDWYRFNFHWINRNQIFYQNQQNHLQSLNLVDIAIYLPLFKAKNLNDHNFITEWKQHISWDWDLGAWKITNYLYQKLNYDYALTYYEFKKEWFYNQDCSPITWKQFQTLALSASLKHLQTVFNNSKLQFNLDNKDKIISVSFNNFCFSVDVIQNWSKWIKQHQLTKIDYQTRQLVFQIAKTNLKIIFTNPFLIKADFFTNNGFNQLVTKFSSLWSKQNLDISITLDHYGWLIIASVLINFGDFLQSNHLPLSLNIRYVNSSNTIWLTFNHNQYQLDFTYNHIKITNREQMILKYYLIWWFEALKTNLTKIDLPLKLTLTHVNKNKHYFWHSNYQLFPFSEIITLMKKSMYFFKHQKSKKAVANFYKKLYH